MSSMTIMYLLSIIGGTIIWLNLFIRLGNQDVLTKLMRFEVHPVTVFFQYLVFSLIFFSTLIWLLDFGWKNKLVVRMNAIFGFNLRIIFYLQFGFHVGVTTLILEYTIICKIFLNFCFLIFLNYYFVILACHTFCTEPGPNFFT